MIGPPRLPAKRGTVYFAEPPWTKESQEWRGINKELPENAPVRLLVSAVENRLNLEPLWASYSSGGSVALRPDLMLKIVLIEIWLGRQHPSQWFADAWKDDFLKWAGMGMRPSRSSWYNFRDRLGPHMETWFREVLQIAREAGITPARAARWTVPFWEPMPRVITCSTRNVWRSVVRISSGNASGTPRKRVIRKSSGHGWRKRLQHDLRRQSGMPRRKAAWTNSRRLISGRIRPVDGHATKSW